MGVTRIPGIGSGLVDFVNNKIARLLGAVITDSAEVENTTTRTAFDQTKTIPKGTLRAGDVVMAVATVEVADNNSTDTLLCELVLEDESGNEVLLAASLATDVADSDKALLIGFATIRSTTTATGFGLGVLDAEAADVAVRPEVNAAATLTVAEDILCQVYATWSVAHADNEANLQDLVLVRFPSEELDS